MEKINLLLAHSERGLGNLIESVVLDACYNQAVVETTRVSRGDELVKLGGSGAFQLVIVAADNLLVRPGLTSSWVQAVRAAEAIRGVRERTATPIIAVTVFPKSEVALMEAGAESVVRMPFKNEKLKAEVRRVLNMPELVEEPEQSTRWSVSGLVWRSLQRLRSA